jgi:hypothetical protein
MEQVCLNIFRIRNNLTILRILPRQPIRKESDYRDQYGRTREKYLWHVVVRGEEKEGVRLFQVSKFLHQDILEGIVNLRVEPKLNLWQKIASKLGSWRLFRFLNRFVPKSKDILDWEAGYDLSITRTWKSPFPAYEAKFIQVSTSAGTPNQIAEWKTVNTEQA